MLLSSAGDSQSFRAGYRRSVGGPFDQKRIFIPN